MYRIGFVLILCILDLLQPVQAQRLSLAEVRKLDAPFRALLAQEYPELNLVAKAALPAPISYVPRNGNANKTYYEAMVATDNPDDLKIKGIRVLAKFRNMSVVRIEAKDLLKLIKSDHVKAIHCPRELESMNNVARGITGVVPLHAGMVNSTTYKGSGVIVCVIDSGIDWDHGDFRVGNNSRIKYLWDTLLTPTGAEISPIDRDPVNLSFADYGVEYSQTMISDDLPSGSPGSDGISIRSFDTVGHGTHVTGSAAGNGNAYGSVSYAGIAPEADIVVVKSGNSSHSSANIINGLAYCDAIGTQLNKPVVVNMSLGSHVDPHDGTGLTASSVDDFTALGNGRVAIVASGNEADDLIHKGGTVGGNGSFSFQFVVPSYTANSGANNDAVKLDIWIDTNGYQEFNVTVTSPTGLTASIGPENDNTVQTSDGDIYLYNYWDYNDDREIYINIYDQVSSHTPRAGTWTVTVTNLESTSVPYDLWLASSTMNATLTGGDANKTVASIGSSNSAITVGAFVSRWRWTSSEPNYYNYSGSDRSDNIANFSSLGPTRDGRVKPDVAAPGQAIISSFSSNSSAGTSNKVGNNQHRINQGTSMATPIVAGIAALLLQANPNLTAAQVKSYLKDYALQDSYVTAAGAPPNNTFGAGKVDAFKSMMKVVEGGEVPYSEQHRYDTWEGYSYATTTNTSTKLAMRFTPTEAGKILSTMFHTGIGNLGGDLTVQVWSNNTSTNKPQSQLGGTVTISASGIVPNTWNVIDLSSLALNVSGGTSYHIVIGFSGGTLAYAYQPSGSGAIDNRSHTSSDGGNTWTLSSHDFRIRPFTGKTESIPGGPLPIVLADFKATNSAGVAQLWWQTASESHSVGFEVEHQYFDQEWRKIAFVEGAGFSDTAKDYKQRVANLAPGRHRFRLKHINTDKSFTYSPEITVTIELPDGFELSKPYPNPFSVQTRLDLVVSRNQDVQVQLVDLLGRIVQPSKKYAMMAYEPQALKIFSEALPNGTYLIRVLGENFSETRKVVFVR